MIKAKVEKMTIEKLAIMVANGFEKTATKEEILMLDKRISTLETSVSKLDFKVASGHDSRFERIEDSLRQLKVHTKFRERV